VLVIVASRDETSELTVHRSIHYTMLCVYVFMYMVVLCVHMYRLLDAILDICGCPAEKFRAICSAIDKLDKAPWEEVRAHASAVVDVCASDMC
jgi:hypothetical protein